jgi:hypothetical protein
MTPTCHRSVAGSRYRIGDSFASVDLAAIQAAKSGSARAPSTASGGEMRDGSWPSVIHDSNVNSMAASELLVVLVVVGTVRSRH